jgi:hypothetical protein
MLIAKKIYVSAFFEKSSVYLSFASFFLKLMRVFVFVCNQKMLTSYGIYRKIEGRGGVFLTEAENKSTWSRQIGKAPATRWLRLKRSRYDGLFDFYRFRDEFTIFYRIKPK